MFDGKFWQIRSKLYRLMRSLPWPSPLPSVTEDMSLQELPRTSCFDLFPSQASSKDGGAHEDLDQVAGGPPKERLSKEKDRLDAGS